MKQSIKSLFCALLLGAGGSLGYYQTTQAFDTTLITQFVGLCAISYSVSAGCSLVEKGLETVIPYYKISQNELPGLNWQTAGWVAKTGALYWASNQATDYLTKNYISGIPHWATSWGAYACSTLIPSL